MKHIFFLFMLITMSLFATTDLSAQDMAWETDYTLAIKKGSQEKKPLLLFFTGSDWSGLGMKMKNEVFSTKDFHDKTAESFIYVEIDFPHHRELSLEEKLKNDALKEKFHVEEFPTIIVLDSNEREITRLYYLPENGSQMADDLLRIVRLDNELQDGIAHLKNDSKFLRRIYQIAQDLQNSSAMERILAEGVKVDEPFFLLEKYRLISEIGKTEEAIKLREKLLTFKSSQIDFTLAMVEFQELANNPAMTKYPEKVIAPLEQYLNKYSQEDPESVWKIEMMIAQTFLEADEWNHALSHAEMAYQSSPKTVKEEIGHLILYLQSHQ